MVARVGDAGVDQARVEQAGVVLLLLMPGAAGADADAVGARAADADIAGARVKQPMLKLPGVGAAGMPTWLSPDRPTPEPPAPMLPMPTPPVPELNKPVLLVPELNKPVLAHGVEETGAAGRRSSGS